MKNNNLTPEEIKYPYVIQRAFKHHVTDIGQLTEEEKKHLKRFVDLGLLYEGLNYNYPKPKKCWFKKRKNFVLPNIIME